MTELAMLVEQARILCSLASTFDHPAMREDLLNLAKRCEALARTKQASAQPEPGEVR